MFEPIHPLPDGCIAAKSVHLKSAGQLYINIINANHSSITLKANRSVGFCTEAVIIDSKYEAFLLTTENKCPALKLNNWIPNRKEIFLTTTHIMNHETSRNIKELKQVRQCGISTKLTTDQRARLELVLIKNMAAFQWDSGQIGRTHLVEHEIPTGNAAPVVQRQYPIPSICKEQLNTQVKEMLKTGMTRDSHSAWRSPVLLVKKVQPDGSIKYRFCIDLKKVNNVNHKRQLLSPTHKRNC